jgi:iron complex outermembrane recepter protein
MKPMRKKLLLTAIALASSLTVQQGFAQAGQNVVNEIQVISSTRRNEGLRDINASISVMNEAELKRVAATHYQEAVNRLPGVNISRNNGQESLVAIRSPILTGAGACGAFLLAEQGIPLRSAGFCNVNEMFDANTENAQRIEVVRGPSSAFYGSNAVHGMVNVLLPEPSERMDLSLETGPRGFLRANTAIGFDNGNFKHLFLVNGVSEEGWRDDSGYDQQKLSWLYQYSTAGGYKLDGGFTATNLNQETAGFVVGKNAYKDSKLRDTNPDSVAYRDNQSLRAWTRISKQFENNWEVVLTPYFRNANLNFIQHFLPGLPIEDNQHSSLGFQFSSYRDLSSNATLAMGLDMETTRGTLKETQKNPATGSAVVVGTVPVGKHYDYEVEATQIAPFLQYQRYFGNGWDMTLGLRYELMDYEYDNKMINGRTRDNGVPCGFGGCRFNRPADRSDDFDNLSPKLALRYRLNDQHNIQARLQKGFRAPQATELYRLQNAQTVADLDSVEIDSFELALEGAGSNWNYSITGFYMDKTDEIITDSARLNLNGSDTHHEGIELAGALALTDTLTFHGVFNIVDHTYDNDQLSGNININGNKVDTAPDTFGNFRIQWQPTPQISTELEWVNMGEYWEDPENLNEYEGHNLLNLRTAWNINSDVNIALNILNLTDIEYAERADWTSFGGKRYFPGEPVRAFLSVNWSLK